MLASLSPHQPGNSCREAFVCNPGMLFYFRVSGELVAVRLKVSLPILRGTSVYPSAPPWGYWWNLCFPRTSQKGKMSSTLHTSETASVESSSLMRGLRNSAARPLSCWAPFGIYSHETALWLPSRTASTTLAQNKPEAKQLHLQALLLRASSSLLES